MTPVAGMKPRIRVVKSPASCANVVVVTANYRLGALG
jgi:hypothetical protein